MSQESVKLVEEEMTKEEIQVNNQIEEAAQVDEDLFDFASINDVSETATLLSLEEIDRGDLLGQLVIPSIDLKMALIRGTTNRNLLAGATTMRADQVMGQGNYPLAGHYMHNGSLFGRLTELELGDWIFLTDKTTIFQYQVYDLQIVDPSRLDLIEDQRAEERGRPILSLMNCYYAQGKNTGDRYFVFAELKETSPYTDNFIIDK